MLSELNFCPLEIMSRCRDPQLQEGEKITYNYPSTAKLFNLNFHPVEVVSR